MNVDNPLHDIHGRPLFALGATARSTHRAGVYFVALDWVKDEPAMVIWTQSGSAAFAICLSSAGKYAEPDGRPNVEGMRESYRALPDLGRGQTSEELRQLTDVILRYLPDLLHMPPQPPEVALEARREPLLEITEHKPNGQIISEASV